MGAKTIGVAGAKAVHEIAADTGVTPSARAITTWLVCGMSRRLLEDLKQYDKEKLAVKKKLTADCFVRKSFSRKVDWMNKWMIG